MKEILAIIIIMTSSSLIGLHLSRGVLSRAAELEKARILIVYIRSQISYSSQNIGLILAEYLRENKGHLPIFLNNNMGNLGHTSAQNEILKELGRLRQGQGLRESDIVCLKSFFSALGRGDIESQTALCTLYETLIDERLNEARHRAEKYAGLYTSLCVMGGLAISILLI